MADGTGTNSCRTLAESARGVSMRQPCKILALMPCDVATMATHAPRASHSARICAFNSLLYRLRLRPCFASKVSSHFQTGQHRCRCEALLNTGSPEAHREAASQIAAATFASFLPVVLWLRYGLTR